METIIAGITLEETIATYSDTLIRIAFQQLKNMTDAEDVVQEVYLKIMQYKGGFVSEEHLKAWLIRVTVNKCRDYYRSAWFRKTVQLHEEMDFLAPEEQVVMEELFQLNPLDRTIIYLHYYEGYKMDEIGKILGKNGNTISSRLQRARKKLKKIILEGSTDYEQ